MKIKVFDIPEDGMDLNASSDGRHDAWFTKIVKDAFQERYSPGAKAKLGLFLVRTADNVQISGSADVDLKPACDRCLEAFDRHTLVSLQVNLAPHRDMNFGDGEGDEGLDEDDVAFSFYKGEEIDLSEIIREMLVLDLPLRYLCSETCKGLCPRCGQNLNLAPCACSKDASDPRLSVLKNFKK